MSQDKPVVPSCPGRTHFSTTLHGGWGVSGGPNCPKPAAFPLEWSDGAWSGSGGGVSMTLTADGTLTWSGPCGDSGSQHGFQGCDPLKVASGGQVPKTCCGLPQPGTFATEVIATEGTPLPAADPPMCATPCPDDPTQCCEDGVGPASAPVTSEEPVRYATGEVVIKAVDIQSGGFGLPWGHTRSFANLQSVNETLGQGFCWKVKEWRYLIVHTDGSVVVQGGPNTSLWFNQPSPGFFVPQFTSKQTLVHDAANAVYKLTELNGTVTQFDDTTGAFKQQTDPAGNTIQVT